MNQSSFKANVCFAETLVNLKRYAFTGIYGNHKMVVSCLRRNKHIKRFLVVLEMLESSVYRLVYTVKHVIYFTA